MLRTKTEELGRLRGLLATLELDVLAAPKRNLFDTVNPSAPRSVEELEHDKQGLHPSSSKKHRHGPSECCEELWRFDPDNDRHGFDPPPDAEMQRLRGVVDERLRGIYNIASAKRWDRKSDMTETGKEVVKEITGHACFIVDNLFNTVWDVVDADKIRLALEKMSKAVEAARKKWTRSNSSEQAENDRRILPSLVQQCVKGVAESIADMDKYGNAYRVVVAAAILTLAGRFSAVIDYDECKSQADLEHAAGRDLRELRIQTGLMLADIVGYFDLDDNGQSNFEPKRAIKRFKDIDAQSQTFLNAMPDQSTQEEKQALEAFTEQARFVAVKGVYLAQKYEHLNQSGRCLATKDALVALAPDHPHLDGAARRV
jgi:hypothetical protein